MYSLILSAIFTLFFSFGIRSDVLTDKTTDPIRIESSSLVDLTGKWHVSGGRLNFVVDIEDYGNSAEIWQISQYGNSDRVLNVTYYSKSGNSVRIKTYEDLGVGETVSEYRLQVVDANTLRGTVTTVSGAVYGLPPVQFKNRVTFKRTN